MSQRSVSQFKALYGSAGTTFPDNTTQEISEADMRQFGEDIPDSYYNKTDDAHTLIPQFTASGTDTYTATPSPAISAYAAGQTFKILFTNANTGAATINLNGVGAAAITKDGTTALVADDIKAGSIKILSYDGTRFQIIGDGGGSGSGTVESVTGDGVDNADPANPVIELPNGLAAVDTTGTAIAFAIPQFYASSGSPATGNITLVATDLVKGMVQVLYHEDSSEPTYPTEFVRVSGFYIPNTLNIIYMHAISSSRIEYMIFQEL